MGFVFCWVWKCLFHGLFGALGGNCGEVLVVVRFDGLGIFVMLVGLEYNTVSVSINGVDVSCVSKYLDSVFVPRDSL
jgi:hypothetical protein